MYTVLADSRLEQRVREIDDVSARADAKTASSAPAAMRRAVIGPHGENAAGMQPPRQAPGVPPTDKTPRDAGAADFAVNGRCPAARHEPPSRPHRIEAGAGRLREGKEITQHEAAARITRQPLAERDQTSLVPADHCLQGVHHSNERTSAWSSAQPPCNPSPARRPPRPEGRRPAIRPVRDRPAPLPPRGTGST